MDINQDALGKKSTRTLEGALLDWIIANLYAHIGDLRV
jgi:hypothetical protein